LFGADPCGLSRLGNRQSDEQLGDQATEIIQSVRPRTQNDDGDGEACQVLLERQATGDSDQGVEVMLCSAQDFTVGETYPPGICEVVTSCPTMSIARRRSTHSSRSTLTTPLRSFVP
jgi:hypothetical protein